MLRIRCPWCGPREEVEFRNGGEAHIARPADARVDPRAPILESAAGSAAASAMNISDADYAQYLFMRKNPKGWHYERWNHAAGCRRWFNALRHTVTHEIRATYKPGEPKPEKPE